MLYGYQTWSGEPLMQAKNDDDLHGGQRSTEVKYSSWSKKKKICLSQTCYMIILDLKFSVQLIVSLLTLLIVKLGGDI